MRRRADGASILYFAYGSNLDERQMQHRCAGARSLEVAVLHGYTLSFDGDSRTWRGPVASLDAQSGGRVHGLLYSLEAADLRALDRFEGYPTSYTRVEVEVLGARGATRRALTYMRPPAREQFPRGAPPLPYLELLQRAYQRLGFDLTLLTEAANWPR